MTSFTSDRRSSANPHRAFGRRGKDRRSQEDRREASPSQAERKATGFAWLSSTFAAQILGQRRLEQPIPQKVRRTYGGQETRAQARARLNRWI